MKLKKIIFSLLMTITLSAPAWGATYCVKTTGARASGASTDPTIPANWTNANCYSTITSIGNPAGGPHTVYVAPGTYLEHIAHSSANWAGATFIGVTSPSDLTPTSVSTLRTGGGAVINVNGLNFHGWNLFAAGSSTYTVKGFTITGVPDDKYGLALTNQPGVSFTNIFLKDIRVLFTIGGTTAFSLGNMFATTTLATSGAGAASIGGTASGTIDHLIMRDSGVIAAPGLLGKRLTVATSGTVNIYNSDLNAGDQGTIVQAGAGTTNVINCIVGTLGSSSYPVSRTAGTISVSYSKIIPSIYSHYTLGPGVTDAGNNIFNGNTKYTKWQRPAYISINHDDPNNADYVLRVEPVLKARGKRGTFFVNPATIKSSPTWEANTRAVLATGTYDIAYHGRTHSSVTATGALWTLSKGAETFSIVRTGGGSITSSGVVNVTGTLNKTLTAIHAELVAAGVTVTGSTLWTTSAINGNLTGEVIATGTNVANVLVDSTGATGLYKDEILDGLSNTKGLDTMDSIFGSGNWDNVSFATPFGYWTADSATLVRSLGFGEYRISNISTTPSMNLNNYNLYKARYMPASDGIITAEGADLTTDANVIQRTRALCEFLLTTGGWLHILTHNDSGTQKDATPAQWALILDTIAEYPQISVLPDKDVINIIKTSGDWNDSGTEVDVSAGDGIWSRTWTDQSDYHLLSGSPAINAGTNTPWTGVANVTDFAGTPITDGSGAIVAPGGTADIGAYEYNDSNGACGSNNTAHFYTLASGDSNNCSVGIETNFIGSGPWSWYCAGSNGGTDSGMCSATLPPPIVINAESTTKFSVTGGLGTFAWSIAGSPAGLTITGSDRGNSIGTVTFTGLPVIGPVTVQVTDGYSTASITDTFTLVVSAPGAPTGVTTTAGNGQATVSFTAPVSDGGISITSYTVTSHPGDITATGSSSPITVTGLTNGTAYAFTVTATNAAGTGSASAPSDSVTPSVTSQPTAVPAVLPIPLAGAGLILFLMLRRRAKKQL